jgi:hypothetical protein
MACSNIVDERQRHGKRRNRLNLSNGMRCLAALTTVTDESRTKLCDGLTRDAFTSRARTNDLSVISALPFAF